MLSSIFSFRTNWYILRHGNGIDRLVGLFILLIIWPTALFCMMGVLYLAFTTADKFGTPITAVPATGISKNYSPMYQTMMPINVNGVQTFLYNDVPESWGMVVDYDGNILDCPVTKAQFEAIPVDVKALIQKGRISGIIYCIGISF